MMRNLPDLAAMADFGSAIAKNLRAGDVVALSGGLGMGKTTLARAIIRALGHEGEVPSPSFAIIELYDPPLLRLPVVHADFYRLNDASELAELGLDEYRQGAALIAEWPEQVGGFSHEAACLATHLEACGQDGAEGRRAIVEPGPAWLERMP